MEIKKQNKQKFSVVIHQDNIKNMINNTLGNEKDGQMFIANLTSVVSSNPLLQNCDAGTIISAGLMANALKLPLNQTLGFAYIIPYKEKAQFQIGYKGFIQLALRSGQYEKIGVKPVHKGETQGQDEFGDEIIKFDHAFDNEEVVGYYAYFKLTNGAKMVNYMTKEQCEKHGKRYSKSYDYLWTNDFDTMAMKTCLKLLLSKYGIMSVDIHNAIKYDQSVLNIKGDEEIVEYVDNPAKADSEGEVNSDLEEVKDLVDSTSTIEDN